MKKIENITIIGSGPAGYTAAIYAARAGLSPLLISGLEQGGQLMITTDVENYPGFEKPVQGPWLMEQMKNQSKVFGTRIFRSAAAGPSSWRPAISRVFRLGFGSVAENTLKRP